MDNLLDMGRPPPEAATLPDVASTPTIAPALFEDTDEKFSDPGKFDWRSDDSIVLGYQPATAVYRNACNAVVIRQEGSGDEDDHFVILRDADAVHRLVAALQDEVGGGHE